MQPIPKEVVVWTLNGKPGNVRSQNSYTTNSGYNLHCSMNNQFLTWGKQTFGINLMFTSDSALMKTHFRVPDKRERDLKTGELIAFGIGGGDAFLAYAERTLGINLEWRKDPVFQWKIFSETGKEGEAIVPGKAYANVNMKVKPDPDFLIYLDRLKGQADVGWTSSPNTLTSIVRAAVKINEIRKELM